MKPWPDPRCDDAPVSRVLLVSIAVLVGLGLVLSLAGGARTLVGWLS